MLTNTNHQQRRIDGLIHQYRLVLEEMGKYFGDSFEKHRNVDNAGSENIFKQLLIKIDDIAFFS